MSNIDINEPIEYITTDGIHHVLYPVSQKVATKVTSETDPDEYDKDVVDGVTDPNLHRRIDQDVEDQYTLLIHSKHSYRTLRNSLHDEDAETLANEECP